MKDLIQQEYTVSFTLYGSMTVVANTADEASTCAEDHLLWQFEHLRSLIEGHVLTLNPDSVVVQVQ